MEGLTASDVRDKGNQKALSRLFINANDMIENGNVTGAVSMIDRAIERVDGCTLRGSPDPSGPGMDWVTDCTSQMQLYNLLLDARAAIAP